MLSFCKKTVHSFLNFSSLSEGEPSRDFPTHSRSLSLSAGALRLLPGMVGNPKPTATPAQGNEKFADINGGVGGFTPFTESLRFESLDERGRMDDEENDIREPPMSYSTSSSTRLRRRDMKFPPPLTSLDDNGHPTFFLKPVRNNGRLEFTMVRIDSPHILRATRQDGRLILHQIKSEPIRQEEEVQVKEQEQENVLTIDQEEKEEEDKEKELSREMEEEEVQLQVGERKQANVLLPRHRHEEKEEQEQKQDMKEIQREKGGESGRIELRQWRFPFTSGDGFLRCNEESSYHQHHHHQVRPLWSHHCVTTM
ncbi:PREDICTED: trichohyalin-like [Nelumbo nucifera]|uniref:Trichohyalin-like n=2 Tax=Nelumbo nucifera TaxID=4432 RepID=A0A1U8QBM0_NELNU|nr:PREDICTED: trichohyalin-like [Nelumbo nucifera]DAD33516.1 TPA_asm: hypothetical protein HUJ06_012367 [Nelumbo nucifera]